MRSFFLSLLTALGCTALISVAPAQELNPSNYDQLVPQGKEVDAIYGDAALSSAAAKAVIANPVPQRKANMTVRNVGGCLIDLATNQFENDQLSCFYPGRNRFPFSDRRLESGSVTVVSPGTETRPACEVEYRLHPELPIVRVTSTWTNSTDREWPVVLEDELRVDSGNEQIRKSPNSEHQLYTVTDLFWQQAYGFRAAEYTIDSSSDRRTSVLKFRPRSGELPKLQPGESYSFTREIIVGRNLVEVRATVARADQRPLARYAVALQDADQRPLADARLEFSREGQSWGVARADEQGQLMAELPLGTYELTATLAGQPVAGPRQIEVNADGDFTWTADSLQLGSVVARIVDADGNPIPAKIEFQGADKTPTPNWGPDSAAHFVRNLAYTANGQMETPLATGTYNVIVSHGPEFNAVFTRLEVSPGETAKLSATLEQVVDTSGWVSADFHSHSSPSGDNTGSQLGRVLNLAAEHIEFAPCTEHNRISTYDDHIQLLGLEGQLATVTGMELTGSPLPLNHQNVFPLIRKPRTQDGGGPQTDADPEQQIERATLWDDRSEKLVQQNHPDIGWLFYDRNGDGSPDAGFQRSFRLMDVMEIHPIDPILNLTPFQYRDGQPKANQRIFNWLQLLNQGQKIYGVVNTDAHYNYHGSGWLRNWVHSDTDDPAELQTIDLVHASEQGRLIMSNGPFLEARFRSADGEGFVVAGQSLPATDGKVTIDVRVQCPNWFDVDRVTVLVNGRPHPNHQYTRADHPEMFADGVVKFERSLELELAQDAHLIVVTGHALARLGEVMGPSGGNQHPAALTNPVFVDVDGDGFKPNRDTLDHPLPVKFGAR